MVRQAHHERKYLILEPLALSLSKRIDIIPVLFDIKSAVAASEPSISRRG
jgi:hypothetical protein